MIVNMYKDMGKVVIKILKGSYINHVRWANYISSSCKFLRLDMCQKLWILAGSRQSYCKKLSGLLFLVHPVQCRR